MATVLRAPAKINLTLEVLARRDDGYHGMRSVMVPLELGDDIEIASADSLSFECDDPTLASESNLALRALRAIESATGARIRASVTLRKRIPAQSGLGGGSSDAASVLLAAAGGAMNGLPQFDALRIARSLGSDVPFFLVETAALVEGTGERVTALGAVPRWGVVLVRPPSGVSTADAYAAIDGRERAIRPRGQSLSLECAKALQRGDFGAVQTLLSNDFHDLYAERPEIRRAVESLRDAGAGCALLAGSGSCVFALAPDVRARDAIVRRLDLPEEFAMFSTAFAQSPAWHG